MKDKYFNFSDILGYGWGVMKANLWFFVGIGIVYAVVNSIPHFGHRIRFPLPPTRQRVIGGFGFGYRCG